MTQPREGGSEERKGGREERVSRLRAAQADSREQLQHSVREGFHCIAIKISFISPPKNIQVQQLD